MAFIERYTEPESKGRQLGVLVRFVFWRPPGLPTAKSPVVTVEACLGDLLTAQCASAE
jgi:hypothetical protein